MRTRTFVAARTDAEAADSRARVDAAGAHLTVQVASDDE